MHNDEFREIVREAQSAPSALNTQPARWRRKGDTILIGCDPAAMLKVSDPNGVAAGLACGAAVSFTPFIGLHFFFAALIAWLIGGNLFASAIGTAVGNPWTFPFIWAFIYRVGIWMLGLELAYTLPEGLSMSYIFDKPQALLLPMFMGSIPTGLVVWLLLFWPVKQVVGNYQRARRRRREKRRVEIESAAEDEEKA